jgi:hypothetical protein
MQTQPNTEPLQISISGRMHELLRTSAEVFNQSGSELVARPLGLDIETCQLAAHICNRLLAEPNMWLQPTELKALFHALEFARREICTEIHAELHELQKTMASIVTSRSPAEIEALADKLPKQGEQAARRLRATLRNDAICWKIARR